MRKKKERVSEDARIELSLLKQIPLGAYPSTERGGER